MAGPGDRAIIEVEGPMTMVASASPVFFVLSVLARGRLVFGHVLGHYRPCYAHTACFLGSPLRKAYIFLAISQEARVMFPGFGVTLFAVSRLDGLTAGASAVRN